MISRYVIDRAGPEREVGGVCDQRGDVEDTGTSPLPRFPNLHIHTIPRSAFWSLTTMTARSGVRRQAESRRRRSQPATRGADRDPDGAAPETASAPAANTVSFDRVAVYEFD